MVTYLVTTELKTFWWWKVLRFFRLKSKREEFEIVFTENYFKKGHILNACWADNFKVKIIQQI